jgi:hypothetical protein
MNGHVMKPWHWVALALGVAGGGYLLLRGSTKAPKTIAEYLLLSQAQRRNVLCPYWRTFRGSWFAVQPSPRTIAAQWLDTLYPFANLTWSEAELAGTLTEEQSSALDETVFSFEQFYLGKACPR